MFEYVLVPGAFTEEAQFAGGFYYLCAGITDDINNIQPYKCKHDLTPRRPHLYPVHAICNDAL